MAAATEVATPEAEQDQTAEVIHPRIVVRQGMQTPWGPAQTARHLAPAIGWVTTAGHGGCVISRSRLELIPEALRRDRNPPGEGIFSEVFFEEDVEWCRIFVAFEAELLESGDEHTVRCIREGHHTDTLRENYPDAYEAHFGVTLLPGQSRAKDERAFYAEHSGDLIVSTAFGDWHANVPDGMVGVVARVGGRGTGRAVAERYFLVPNEEYDARGRFGFVIDTTRHEEIAKFF